MNNTLDDNFVEDLTVSKCGNCKWKNTTKCYRCIHRNFVEKMEIWQPNTIPFIEPIWIAPINPTCKFKTVTKNNL